MPEMWRIRKSKWWTGRRWHYCPLLIVRFGLVTWPKTKVWPMHIDWCPPSIRSNS